MDKIIKILILIFISIPVNSLAIVDKFGVDLGKLRKLSPPIRTKVDVNPGDIIDSSNWKKIEGMCSPYILERIKNGTYKMKIGETKPLPVPPQFTEATKRYYKRVKLGPRGELINYVAGIPFPDVDPSDPQAGLKIMWNFYWRWRGDDYIMGSEDGSRPTKRYVIDRYGNEIEAEVLQYYLKPIGRITLKPKPFFKGKEHIEEYELWISYYPRDVSGTTVLWTRVTDPDKWDDMWIYLPSIRRIRRFPTSQRCATRAPTDYTWDDSWGFQGKITRFNYKLIGEGKILTLAHQRRIPYKRNRGDLLPIDEEYEIRDCWIVEQISKDPRYCYGKRVNYIDKKVWQVDYIVLYDRKMDLWKDAGLFALSPSPYYKRKYGIDVYAVTGGYFMNYQTAHTTITQIPVLAMDVGLRPELFSLSTLQQLQRGGIVSVRK